MYGSILRGMIALEIDEFMHTFCCHPNLVSKSHTMNDAASLATEQCLLSGVAKMLSSAKVRDVEEEKLQAIALESDEAMQESTRLSDRVMTLENGLGILRSHPGQYETGPSPDSLIRVAQQSRLTDFGYSFSNATSHPRSGLFESPSTNNTSGICSHQPSNLFDYNREMSKPFGGNTPKGTPDSFFPYTDDSRQKKEYFQFIAAYYAYRNMLFEVGLLLYAQEMINAKYLYTNMGSKTTPLAANGQCSYTRDTNQHICGNNRRLRRTVSIEKRLWNKRHLHLLSLIHI